MDEFTVCQKINELLSLATDTKERWRENEKLARNELIKLLDYLEHNQIAYSPLVNHFIRKLGLYPYIRTDENNVAAWQERYVYEAFKVDTGDSEVTLHREQSALLKELLDGNSIAVSAPTSFGKSFVIDAFISLRKPANIMIIVPTIALADETRRRLQKKFASKYQIITTADSKLETTNIFIFPQERALSYLDKISNLDILIIDEFYKAAFDKERSPALLKAILEFRRIAKQCYFLAPNIQGINEEEDNIFTKGVEFVPLDFNTVYTEVKKYYDEPEYQENKEEFKKKTLLDILHIKQAKSLIYAGIYPEIDKVADILKESREDIQSPILHQFSDWLKTNYGREYVLSDLVKKGIGIHNGRLHRSLSQIQIRLFEEENSLDTIISTSSIIEGVNTAAENVVIWSDKNGRSRIDDFTYKNIIGRGGRMFRHFIGKIFLLEKPPQEKFTQLTFDFSDNLAALLSSDRHSQTLTRKQEIKIIAFQEEIDGLIGHSSYRQLIDGNKIQSLKSETTKKVIRHMKEFPSDWRGLAYLNSQDSNQWEKIIFQILPFAGDVGTNYTGFVSFIRTLSASWDISIPSITSSLRSNGITIEKFFELERKVSFVLPALLSDINEIYNCIFSEKIDVSQFIMKTSNAFLPKLVYELEEYGLPRMLSKKICLSGIINLESNDLSIHDVLRQFVSIGQNKIMQRIENLHPFEEYILDYFYEGIQN